MQFAVAYKAFQRIYKFGGQPLVYAALDQAAKERYEAIFGKKHAKTLMQVRPRAALRRRAQGKGGAVAACWRARARCQRSGRTGVVVACGCERAPCSPR